MHSFFMSSINFPLLSNVHSQLANKPIITGTTGLYHPYENHLIINDNNNYTGEIINRLPRERNHNLLYPALCNNWNYKYSKPEFYYNLSNFHRYRLNKLNNEKHKQVSDIFTQDYCDTCFAQQLYGGTFGCRRNVDYAKSTTTSRQINQSSLNHCRFEDDLWNDHYGYLYERLNSHSTGNV
ncbi:hypothetical protein MN116_008094 [Schistosoma mekongi]|uniref:Uncharacterized protein n=1 Tax=Schistosoma mekongi TaxID=38744 RepID=A0AAE1Z790_SCHME|nr:hypothetical protein MN116_008094 [Schistosoma mekongi]